MDFQIALMLSQDGITNGAIYALLALALVLVFAVTRVIFIPQGEFIAFGALTLAQLAHALPQARLQGEGATVFASVSTDSRTLAAGALFVALRGARFDGHDYAAQAQERGAVALLVDRPLDSTLPQLVVPDTLRALGLF